MATSRPFAYNTGSPIGGTDQVGNLAIGYPTEGFESTGLQWWSGPDEDPGYVIAKPVALNSQPTPVPDDALILSTTYKGADINLSNGNQTAYQQFGYQMSVLGETLISGTDKVMFSILSTSLAPLTIPQSRFIGVGNTSMNYQGNPYGGYPGNDTNSIGFNAIGDYYYNGIVVQSSLPTWTQGDIVDIAISHGQYWWIRVNGGNWNNNPSANPATLTGGLTMNGLTNYYPALCPGYEGTMEVLNNPTYGCPSGYNFLGNVSASVGFSRSSALDEASFVDLANNLTGYSQNFTTGDQANTWLNANGYWTSYVGGTGPAGGFSITISEVGSNVVMTASGTLNINDLTLISSGTGPFGGGGLGVNSATFVLGSTPSYFDEYSGFTTTPSNFGTGGGLGSSSSTGDIMGVIYQGAPPYHLVVPSGYTSGTYITGSQTFNTQTFSSLGLTVGTYTYTWGSGPNADSINVVVGGTGSTGSTGGTGGATGAGWYFYAPEGPLVDGPPFAAGQAIFTDNLPAGGTDVTFNPNKSGGVNFLNFNVKDVDAVDYTTQFTNLQTNGGTVSVTQNGDTATYVLTAGMAFIQVSGGNSFVAINAAAATQTVNASGSFVSGSPITIAFS